MDERMSDARLTELFPFGLWWGDSMVTRPAHVGVKRGPRLTCDDMTDEQAEAIAHLPDALKAERAYVKKLERVVEEVTHRSRNGCTRLGGRRCSHWYSFPFNMCLSCSLYDHYEPLTEQQAEVK